VTPPPHSPPCKGLPLLGDIFSKLVGIVVAVTGQNSPRQRPNHRLAHRCSPVSCWYCLTHENECCACVDEKNSPIWGFTSPAILTGHWDCHRCVAGPSLLGPERAEPPSKKVHPWSFLWVSSRYAWTCPSFMPLEFLSLNSKGDFLVEGVIP
jgi:hypothetical protein